MKKETTLNCGPTLISEAVKDPMFIEYLGQTVQKLIEQRKNRPSAKPGFHYKRDWYDKLLAEGNMNTDFFLKNAEALWLKKSKLCRQDRLIVEFVCNSAFQQMYTFYSQQNEKTKNNAEGVVHTADTVLPPENS